MQVSRDFLIAEASQADLYAGGVAQNIPGGCAVAEKMRGRVLVVDDEETVGVGMSEILKDEGFEAAYVVSGRDAVQAVKETHFNLVFMDIVMPGMNGLDTFREIRKARPNTR